MLRVHLHSGPLSTRKTSNRLAVIDIAYASKSAFSDYMVAMSMAGVGEVAPDTVARYPRWSGSLWDLTARACTRLLYRADQAPAMAPPDRRCAYATHLCAFIERATLTDQGIELGTAEISQSARARGTYTATFDEDILGKRSAQFAYGLKSLNPVDLLLRAICFAYFGQDTLAPRPKLILPATMRIDGVDMFDVVGLAEPARTGFLRHRVATDEPMAKADAYAAFLMKG
jgi:hypothetical protein